MPQNIWSHSSIFRTQSPLNTQVYLISKAINNCGTHISTSWINLILLTFLFEKVFTTELKSHQAKAEANFIYCKGRKPPAFFLISLLDNFWIYSLKVLVCLKHAFTLLNHIQGLSSSISIVIAQSLCIPNTDFSNCRYTSPSI